jgi:hypothetical protein
VTGTPGAGAGLATIGFLTLLMGAWAGIVPYIGNLIGFSADGRRAWVWSFQHTMLWLIPGAVAVLMGLLMMGTSPRARAGMSRIGPMWAGFIVAVCGAWLVIGPLAWPVLRSNAHVFRAASPFRELLYQIGYSFGPGLLLALFGGTAIGIAMLSKTRVASTAVPASTRNEERIAA